MFRILDRYTIPYSGTTRGNRKNYPSPGKTARAWGIDLGRMESELDKHNPLERLGPLAEAGVPILHFHGDADKVVPLLKNSGELARRYRAIGGHIDLIVVQGKGHELAPEYWEDPRLPAFFLKHGLSDTTD